jgi:opacity protein-like surface antigen
MRELLLRLALALALAMAAYAADVTGNWSGTFKVGMPDGTTQDDTVYLSLKQTGSTITGTAGPSIDQQAPIRVGKIEGNKITLDVPVPQGSFKFDITLQGDHLQGEVTASAQGQTVKAKMDATRAK